MQTTSRTDLTDRSLVALAFLNFFLADARDGLGPFLDGFLATHGWSPMTLGIVATLGGVLGMVATPLFGAWVDASHRKRTLIIVPSPWSMQRRCGRLRAPATHRFSAASRQRRSSAPSSARR